MERGVERVALVRIAKHHDVRSGAVFSVHRVERLVLGVISPREGRALSLTAVVHVFAFGDLDTDVVMVDRIDILRVEGFEREYPAAPLVVERKIAFPQARILEIGIRHGDLGTGIGRLGGFVHIGVLIDAAQETEIFQRLAFHVDRPEKHAVVARLIRNPDIGRRIP